MKILFALFLVIVSASSLYGRDNYNRNYDRHDDRHISSYTEGFVTGLISGVVVSQPREVIQPYSRLYGESRHGEMECYEEYTITKEYLPDGRLVNYRHPVIRVRPVNCQ